MIIPVNIQNKWPEKDTLGTIILIINNSKNTTYFLEIFIPYNITILSPSAKFNKYFKQNSIPEKPTDLAIKREGYEK